MSTVLVINSIRAERMVTPLKDNSPGAILFWNVYPVIIRSFENIPMVELIISRRKRRRAFQRCLHPGDRGQLFALVIEAFSEIFQTPYSRIIYLWNDTPFLDADL